MKNLKFLEDKYMQFQFHYTSSVFYVIFTLSTLTQRLHGAAVQP